MLEATINRADKRQLFIVNLVKENYPTNRIGKTLIPTFPQSGKEKCVLYRLYFIIAGTLLHPGKKTHPLGEGGVKVLLSRIQVHIVEKQGVDIR